MASVAKCWRQKPQISLSRGVVLSQSTFHLVANVFFHYRAESTTNSRLSHVYSNTLVIKHMLLHFVSVLCSLVKICYQQQSRQWVNGSNGSLFSMGHMGHGSLHGDP